MLKALIRFWFFLIPQFIPLCMQAILLDNTEILGLSYEGEDKKIAKLEDETNTLEKIYTILKEETE
jgi:hypothetical protein